MLGSSLGPPSSVGPMRPATTLALALLLVAILLAGIIAIARL
jgi:hypothetical protein